MALHIESIIAADPEAIEEAVEALITRPNERLMARGGYPPLYSTRVRYREEPAGADDWKTADRVLEDGIADCEDACGYRAAELRRAGDRYARVRVIRIDNLRFHALVQRGDGQMEDPSRVLIAKEANAMSSAMKPTISLTESGQHCIGSICVPLAGGRTIEVHELGFDPWSALTAALEKVWGVVSDPRMQAVLPVQAGIAIQIAKTISEMKPESLRALINDPRATDAQKELARKMLVAKTGSDGMTEEQHTRHAINDWTILQKGPQVGISADWPGTNVTDHRGGAPQGGVKVVNDPTRMTATYAPQRPGTIPLANPGRIPSIPGAPGAPPAGTPGDPGTMAPPPTAMPPPGAVPQFPPPGGTPGVLPQSMPGLTVVSLYNPSGITFPGYVWVETNDGMTPGHWERPHKGWPQLTPQSPVIYPQLPGFGLAPPGYPGGYPGYPGGYPGYPGGYPGYPGSPPIYQGYPYTPPYPGAYPGYGGYGDPWGYWMQFNPGATWGAEPMTPDETAAVNLWGPNAFAEGSFPGYI